MTQLEYDMLYGDYTLKPKQALLIGRTLTRQEIAKLRRRMQGSLIYQRMSHRNKVRTLRMMNFLWSAYRAAD